MDTDATGVPLPTGLVMRATLWQGQAAASAVIARVLVEIFAAAGITLDVVLTLDDLLAAGARQRRASDHDFLLIDCCAGDPADIDRCVAVATRTPRAVHILHPREETVRAIGRIARRPVVWMPSAFTVAGLLDKLRALQALAAADHSEGKERPVLTTREREVLALVLDGSKNQRIAAELRISPETVKSHVCTLLTKLGASSRADLIARGHAEPPVGWDG